MIQETCRDTFPVDLKSGRAWFFRALDDAARKALSALIPLPSARARFESDSMRRRVEDSLKEIGLDLKTLRIRHPRENFFSRGERAATFRPAGLAGEWGPDDLYPGRSKLALRFDLPRGSYATIIVKRLSEDSGVSEGLVESYHDNEP